MAKEDFCFTYYDGDAARDVAHMNRLERGAYHDFIVSQRKFGHLSLSLIKKTFGSDFEKVWEALEIVLKKDAAGNYFIEWLENSIEKMRRQSDHQSRNGKLGGRPKKSELKANKNPVESQTETHEKPLENGDGNVNGYEAVFKSGDEKFIVPQMCKLWYESFPAYTADKENDFEGMGKILGFMTRQAGINNEHDQNSQIKVLNTLQLIADQVNREPFWINKPIKSIANSIQEFYNKIKNPVNGKESKAGKLQSIRDDAAAVRNRRRTEREQAAD